MTRGTVVKDVPAGSVLLVYDDLRDVDSFRPKGSVVEIYRVDADNFDDGDDTGSQTGLQEVAGVVTLSGSWVSHVANEVRPITEQIRTRKRHACNFSTGQMES